jgi:hypothetical protein
MIFRNTLLACVALSAVLPGLLHGPALAQTTGCREPQPGTKNAPLLSPPLAHVVTGTGRLQFHSAPNSNCRMNSVFVIPRDELITYAQTNDGWSSVTYTNPKTGQDASGWVRSTRLKETGTVGPRQ